MPESRLEYLFNCYVQDNYTIEEEKELMALLIQSENQLIFQKLIDRVIENTGSELQMNDREAASILQNIFQKDRGLVVPFKKEHTIISIWRVAAVAILFIAIASLYFISNKNHGIRETVSQVNEKHIVSPGGNKAVLTTSDGSIILLDSIKNGTVIQKGATKIRKLGGLLIYDVSALTPPGVPILNNTLTIPRGGQYQVVLSDGSKVWLNSSSSLHFPSAFSGNLREVELTGEGYFEVAKNKEKPFQVKVGDMKVKVLGTHFNINAYSDENAVKTSLLEGSVQITKGNVAGLLKPGQQAVLVNQQDKLEIINANIEEVMAWKNGLFQFDGADLPAIMREISRWYNVEIVYDGKIPRSRFEGKISRNAQLSEVLRILELSNVRFTVIGDKIIVY